MDLAAKIGSTRATIYRDAAALSAARAYRRLGRAASQWLLAEAVGAGGPASDAPKPVSVPKAKREHDRWVRMKKEEPERIDIRHARAPAPGREEWELIRRDPASWIEAAYAVAKNRVNPEGLFAKN